MISSPASSVVSRREALRWLGLTGIAVSAAPFLSRALAAETPAAPSLAGAQPGFYRFKIGAFEALSVNDGHANFPTPAVWPATPTPEVTAALASAYLPTDTVQLPFNVLVVKMGRELVLIDSGCGSAFGPAGGRLVPNLAAAGVKQEQVTAVFLSHAHGDHHGGLLGEGAKPTFPNAKHFIGRKEFEFWTGSSPDLSGMGVSADDRKGTIAGAQATLGALKSRWEFIQPGDKLLDGIEVVEAYGHTPGHLAFLFSSGNDQLLHFVDAVHHFNVSFNHPTWSFFGDTQPPIAIATRKKLFDRAAADQLRLFGAHMAFPALGRVRSVNGVYDYRTEAWTF